MRYHLIVAVVAAVAALPARAAEAAAYRHYFPYQTSEGEEVVDPWDERLQSRLKKTKKPPQATNMRLQHNYSGTSWNPASSSPPPSFC